jgi:2-dehydro-3-deoxyphosphogluconate aldolase/(4S)-4-hydroxy-2-oxoglutarate aldolase
LYKALIIHLLDLQIFMFSWDLFYRLPVVGILRGVEANIVSAIMPLYLQSGFTNIEITMNSAQAPETIEALATTYKTRLNVGAGTVCTEQDLEVALKAGASYVVTPIVHEKVITACVRQNIPVFPGAYTPTEIFTAWNLGASMVKVFPATTLGAGYIKEVKAPLNNIRLLPTGGVSAQNMADFFKAGADGVGMGSQLFPPHLLNKQDRNGLAEHFSQVYQAYRQYKELVS